jgi:hypothetical protein
VSTLFTFHVSCSESGVVGSLGTYISTCCMYVCYLQWVDVCVWMQMHVHADWV